MIQIAKANSMAAADLLRGVRERVCVCVRERERERNSGIERQDADKGMDGPVGSLCLGPRSASPDRLS